MKRMAATAEVVLHILWMIARQVAAQAGNRLAISRNGVSLNLQALQALQAFRAVNIFRMAGPLVARSPVLDGARPHACHVTVVYVVNDAHSGRQA